MAARKRGRAPVDGPDGHGRRAASTSRPRPVSSTPGGRAGRRAGARTGAGGSGCFRGTARPHAQPPSDAATSAFTGLPPAFRELIAEFSSLEPPASVTSQRKRRRVGGQSLAKTDQSADGNQSAFSTTPLTLPSDTAAEHDLASTATQTVFDVDAATEDDSDEDMEWEDVAPPSVRPSREASPQPPSLSDIRDVQITLQKHDEVTRAQKAAARRRKPASAAEKQMRLAVHKVHLLCLLSHLEYRSAWCNDEEVQRTLVKMLPTKVRSFLRPDRTLAQHTRSMTFADGLKQAMQVFARRFKVTGIGLQKAYWLSQPENEVELIAEQAEVITSIEEFRTKAGRMEGSRDLGAQLFCAMLRGAGLETRLVSSLQVLSFSGEAKGRPALRDVMLVQAAVQAGSAGGASAAAGNSATPTSEPATRITRPKLGRPTTTRRVVPPPPAKAASTAALSLVSRSHFPVFWVEAWNEAMQKWVVVDPLVTMTINKPAQLEPPLSDPANGMSYVIAVEDDLSARDVTQRYAKSYCAKTRRTRVESTPGGQRWWRRVMRHFERLFLEDRDQLELAELTAKAAAEPMPRNIQDFKDHPFYALERHLRHNEVIHPRREIGTVTAGKLSRDKPMPALEPVFRRTDVHVCKSADGWYRLGRTLKVGEQPLKRVKPRMSTTAQARRVHEDSDRVADLVIPMYAEFQTEPYVPPPVVNDEVPKNAYGNIDLYVPSMVPAGGFHLNHPDAARAARLLGIDYAEAVTGFTFKGRAGTAVKNGIVASVAYKEALEAVIRGFVQDRIEELKQRKQQLVLQAWKEMLTKLRIRERVAAYFTAEELDEQAGSQEPDVAGSAASSAADDNEELGGGFLPEESCDETAVAAGPQHVHLVDNDTAGHHTDEASPSDDDGGELQVMPTTAGGINPDNAARSAVLSRPLHERYGLADSASHRLRQRAALEAESRSRKSPVTPDSRLVMPFRRAAGQGNGILDTHLEASLELASHARQDDGPSEPDVAGSQPHPMSGSASTASEGGEQLRGCSPTSSISDTGQTLRADSEAAGSTPAESTSDIPTDEADDIGDDLYDQQSMISHDPEDDDAEPDWLPL
ncbi:hypothetical protein KEM52_002423 [Ascosphaera acerosa]|nr:hypothetical protein KEM52_002423 [Ascosphaera acerosa]